MYCAYFGLDENPFTITPDPRYLYLSKRHREALAHLLFGIGAGGGFVQLTGEIGMGKTTLCRGLLEQLPDNVDVALILNPRVTALELVASICDELHVAYPADSTSLKRLIDALNGYLLEAHARGRRTILIIDEAQNLSIEVLEQVRLLTNLETTQQKLLQIILIGQPELKLLLKREDLRQLAQRITARYHLSALASNETCAYVAHRLQVAGMKTPLFTRAALRRVHRLSGGIPRLINVICDRAMLGAYAVGRQRITAAMTAKAAREVFAITPWWRRRRWRVWFALTAALAGASAAAWVYVPWQSVHALRPTRVIAPFKSSASSATPRPRPAATPTPIAATSATVRAWLRDTAAEAGTEDSAFASLFNAAGLNYSAATGKPCERAQQLGWRCLTRTGTWNNLRSYKTPAVVTLIDAAGQRYAALAAPLADGRVRLQVNTRAQEFPLAAVDPLWLGEYTLLWKPPPIQATALVPGMHGGDVRWLRERLDALQGPSEPPLDPVFFDDELRARVERFQRSHGLQDDGIVGTQTLIDLTLATPDPRVAPTP
ncbi:MAG: ExeA family protein [Gammaproteobacteria bacterium]